VTGLASGGALVQVVGAIGPSVVALAAIGVAVWSTRRTLDEARDDRFWSRRAEVYVDLVRRVLQERQIDLEETLMTMSSLDAQPALHWQSSRDRDKNRQERNVLVEAYASDQVRKLYEAWDHALLHLAGVVQPTRVTGRTRPDDRVSAAQEAIERVATASDELLDQLRVELHAGHTLGSGRVSLIRRFAARADRRLEQIYAVVGA
jgi:hypothetical protein